MTLVVCLLHGAKFLFNLTPVLFLLSPKYNNDNFSTQILGFSEKNKFQISILQKKYSYFTVLGRVNISKNKFHIKKYL